MVAAVAIRPAVEADAAAIAAIYAGHVAIGVATFDTEAPSVEATREKVASILEHGWPCLAAERDSAVVGYAYATQFRDRAAYAATCENSIYVSAEHVGQGIGKALLAELLTASEATGFRQMIAVISGGEPSISLHAAQGFRHAGRMQSVGRKFGQWIDTVYMQRELGDGDRTVPGCE